MSQILYAPLPIQTTGDVNRFSLHFSLNNGILQPLSASIRCLFSTLRMPEIYYFCCNLDFYNKSSLTRLAYTTMLICLFYHFGYIILLTRLWEFQGLSMSFYVSYKGHLFQSLPLTLQNTRNPQSIVTWLGHVKSSSGEIETWRTNNLPHEIY